MNHNPLSPRTPNMMRNGRNNHMGNEKVPPLAFPTKRKAGVMKTFTYCSLWLFTHSGYDQLWKTTKVFDQSFLDKTTWLIKVDWLFFFFKWKVWVSLKQMPVKASSSWRLKYPGWTSFSEWVSSLIEFTKKNAAHFLLLSQVSLHCFLLVHLLSYLGLS